jgi:hypothetical protein
VPRRSQEGAFAVRTAALPEAQASLRPVTELRWQRDGLHLRLTAQGPWETDALLAWRVRCRVAALWAAAASQRVRGNAGRRAAGPERLPALVRHRFRQSLRQDRRRPRRSVVLGGAPILRWLLLAAAVAPFILAYIIATDAKLRGARRDDHGELDRRPRLIFYNGVIDRPGSPSARSLKFGWLALVASLVMVVASAMRRPSTSARAAGNHLDG